MADSAQPYIRPGFFMSHVWNPINRRLGFSPTLTVRGRRSGEPITLPIGEPLEFHGARYLVSGRGVTHWARNLRATGPGEFRFHGRREPFRAVELEGAERDQVVAAYREKLGHAVDTHFEQIPDPANHPVFRMDPIEAARTANAQPVACPGARAERLRSTAPPGDQAEAAAR